MADAYIQSCAWLDHERIIYSYWNGTIYCRDIIGSKPAQLIATTNTDKSGFFLLLIRPNAKPLLTSYFEHHQLKSYEVLEGRFAALNQTTLPDNVTIPTAGLWSPFSPDTFYLGHGNNTISIWEIESANIKLKKIVDLKPEFPSPTNRNFQDIRALRLMSDHQLIIAGESGMISIYDVTLDKFLLHHDYNSAANQGMNDIYYAKDQALLFGTCCVDDQAVLQLYAWKIVIVKPVPQLLLVNTWQIPIKDNNFGYANRCRMITVASQDYLLVSMGDGTVRIARVMFDQERVDLDWIHTIELEYQGGAEMEVSPTGSNIVMGIQNIHLRELHSIIQMD